MYTITLKPAMVKESTDTKITTPADAIAVCADMATMAQESVQILTLNSRNRLIDRHLITLGIADGSFMHAREIFRQAILDNASSIIVLHNHPSGDPEPSADDIRNTKTLVEAGRIIGIEVMDHAIIAAKGSFSMRETNVVQFSK